LAVVSQEPQLFNMSIGRNIEFGCKGADKDQVVQAASDAIVHDMITGVGGYTTMVGERGLRLSGGQRQRLAIARAIIRDPSVLVFDEATSALDPITESQVLETINRVSDGRTLITVTHNLANVSNCDCIFVLNGGRLVEKGTHSDLLDAGGLYESLFSEQSRRKSVLRTRGTSSNENYDLRDVPLLAGLDKEALGVVSRLLRVERYRVGDYIYNQGDSADCLYFIAAGEIEIVVNNGEATRHINALHKGDYFGEVALLGNELRTASARATLPSRLYSLSKTDFVHLLDREPNVRQAINTVVRRRRQEIAMADASPDLSSSAQL
jgi:ATP-binding cassette, subfamily B, bacterial